MAGLKKYIKDSWINALHTLDEGEFGDIYAFSFFVYDEDDDPKKPTLTIGYNTLSNFEREKEMASDVQEAKWNYAFWLQNNLTSIGTSSDIKGRSLVESWIFDLGLHYDKQNWHVAENQLKAQQITTRFVMLLMEVVQESHQEKLVDLPILIHELEYYDQIKDQNIIANGQERVLEFVNWIDSF